VEACIVNERIKELAEQSGLEWVEMMQTWLANDAEIERFAELVRQDERNKKWTQKQWTDYELAIAADEREACAKLCDPYTHGQWFAKAIRARGNT
jgi:hypothetical protein